MTGWNALKLQVPGLSYHMFSMPRAGIEIAPTQMSETLKQTSSKFDALFSRCFVAISEAIKRTFTAITIGEKIIIITPYALRTLSKCESICSSPHNSFESNIRLLQGREFQNG